ncbi:MAG: Crp/Fnr family transcriptional regulator [Planctomycetales bacterium]
MHALSASSFLIEIPVSIQEQLSALSKPFDFAGGEEIFSEGQIHDNIYLVESGHVRLSMFLPQRGSVPILTVGSGEFVGWTPLFSKNPMSATATAIETTRCWGFSGAELGRLCASNHDLGYYVMRQMAKDLSKRLMATRLQLLDLFGEQQPLSPKKTDPAGITN